MDCILMFDDDDLADLGEMEAAWPEPTEAKPQKPRNRPGKQDPNWRPREKGERSDYNSPEYQRAYEDAARGLPVLRALNWLQAQLRDGGPQRGRTQFSVKLEFSDAKLEHCTRSGLKAMKRTRWANLSTVPNFRTNLRRKEITNDFDQHDRDNGEQVITWANGYNHTDYGAPSNLLGWVSNRFEGKGTLIFGSQHVLLYWRPEGVVNGAATGWLPTLLITRRRANGTADTNSMNHLTVDLSLPAPINRDGTPRSQTSPYTHVGSWFSAGLQERIDTAKAVKVMREADIKARGGRA